MAIEKPPQIFADERRSDVILVSPEEQRSRSLAGRDKRVMRGSRIMALGSGWHVVGKEFERSGSSGEFSADQMWSIGSPEEQRGRSAPVATEEWEEIAEFMATASG